MSVGERTAVPLPPEEVGFDEATETRWQQAIYELCQKFVGPGNEHLIDGGGCDSGDALDFTLSEISQTFALLSPDSRAPASGDAAPTPRSVAEDICNRCWHEITPDHEFSVREITDVLENWRAAIIRETQDEIR